MSEPNSPTHYDAAALHLQVADSQQPTSHGSGADIQRAQVHALLAVVDELRALRASIKESAKDVSSSVGALDQEQASLWHIASAMYNLVERLPRQT